MGPLSASERVMLGTFGLLLVLWANVPAMIFGSAFTLDPTVVAFVGLFILIITGTLDWDAILPAAKEAGAEWYVVEHDEPKDPLGNVTQSAAYLAGKL